MKPSACLASNPAQLGMRPWRGHDGLQPEPRPALSAPRPMKHYATAPLAAAARFAMDGARDGAA